MYELLLHPDQMNGGKANGYVVEDYLKENGLLDRVFGVEDGLIQNWINHPEDYPFELREKIVFLWGSRGMCNIGSTVVYLIWDMDHLLVVSRWIGFGDWDSYLPALIKIPSN